MKILYEDAVMLAAVKPQGMPAQADKTGDLDLLSALEEYTGQPLGLLHRLDRPVGGVMLFAKEKRAEAFLAKEIQEHRLKKAYLTVLCGRLPAAEGGLEDYLLKNARTNLSEVVSKERKGAKRAALRYRRLAERETEQGVLTLAEIELETGITRFASRLLMQACPSGGIKNITKAFRSAAKRRLRSGLTAWRASIPIRNSRFPLPPSPKGSRFHFFRKN